MAENIEFIAAKDLPEATGDEVSILCLENGALKQKPGASLGGSGGGYVLVVKAEEVTESTDTSMTIVSTESYDSYAEMVYNGGSVWLDITAPMNPILGELFGDMPIRCLVNNFGVGEVNGIKMALLGAKFEFMDIAINIMVKAAGTWLPA